MPFFKIVSDITKMGSGKVKMDVEFYDDDSVKIGNTEEEYEVDADTDDGIKAVLSQAAKDRAASVNPNDPNITLTKDVLIEAE